ncbi:NADPH-dependent F420 reductase [Vogesella oryzae]|uniref:NADPH-dependent F420 reductase n=1 Tax=Vogesella oryzae TaxID=1735285 RepID=UPI00158286AF|nr:NAD(P)-binding domain-containing protein [Vogesella oryzae]
MHIAIIGKGNVGSALQAGLSRLGHQVQAVGRDPQQIHQAALASELLILAMPFSAMDDVITALGVAADSKIVIDATNLLTESLHLADGFDTSGAEQLQARLPAARVIKAFNTCFASTMSSGHVKGEQLVGLVAGDHAPAKHIVLEIVDALGFDAVDAGPLLMARYLEPMALLNIRLGYVQGLGPDIGFRLVR